MRCSPVRGIRLKCTTRTKMTLCSIPDMVASLAPPVSATPKPLANPALNTGIVATVFGGIADPETSAYTGKRLDDTVLGVGAACAAAERQGSRALRQ